MSEILDIAHDMARDLFKAGAMDEITMRQVKALCLEKFRVSSFKFQVRGAGLRARQSRVRTAHHLFHVLWVSRRLMFNCLPAQRAFRPDDIRRIRLANHVSQAVFAALLGIGKTTVQQWEQGQKRPSGPAQRLLDLIDRKGLAALG